MTDRASHEWRDAWYPRLLGRSKEARTREHVHEDGPARPPTNPSPSDMGVGLGDRRGGMGSDRSYGSLGSYRFTSVRKQTVPDVGRTSDLRILLPSTVSGSSGEGEEGQGTTCFCPWMPCTIQRRRTIERGSQERVRCANRTFVFHARTEGIVKLDT